MMRSSPAFVDMSARCRRSKDFGCRANRTLRSSRGSPHGYDNPTVGAVTQASLLKDQLVPWGTAPALKDPPVPWGTAPALKDRQSPIDDATGRDGRTRSGQWETYHGTL